MDMADLHAGTGATTKQFALVHEPAADTGAGEHAEQTAHALARAEMVFAVRAGVHIVDNDYRTDAILGQILFQRHVAQAKVRRVENDTAVNVEPTRAADPDGAELSVVEVRGLQCFLHGFHDATKDALGTFAVLGFFATIGDDVEVLVKHRSHHFRSEEHTSEL